MNRTVKRYPMQHPSRTNSRHRSSAAWFLPVFAFFALLTTLSCESPTEFPLDNDLDVVNNPDYKLQAPRSLTASLSDLDVVLTWEADVTASQQYVLEKRIGDGDFSVLITLSRGTTTYTDGLREKGTLPLTYRIYTTYQGNTSPNSTLSNPVTFDYALDVVTEGEGQVEERLVQTKSTDFTYGSVIELTAVPAQRWAFAEWIGVDDSTGAVARVTLTDDRTVTAVFREVTVPLTVTVDGQGTVAERVVQPKTTEYSKESVVELTAEPAAGWAFTGWSGDVTGTQNPVQVTMDAPKTVAATFERIQYPLTVQVAGEGSVSERVVRAASKTTDYVSETVVELTATPAQGWLFAGWSGDASGSTNPLELTMNGPKTVTATFERIQFPLTVQTVGEGSVDERVVQGAAKTTDYAIGSVVELTAAPAPGWVFSGWSGDLEGMANPIQVTMDGPKTVTATFKEQFQLTITTTGRGQVAERVVTAKSATYIDGQIVELTAVAEDGWILTEWKGDASGTEDTIRLLMDSDKEVTAAFWTAPVTDLQGTVYRTVPIGEQIWMAENLRVGQYQDGSALLNSQDTQTWSILADGAWVYYDNDLLNSVPYGKLYNWYAVNDPRGLCPEGWHVPDSIEWNAMVAELGGASVAGGKMKAEGTDYWDLPNAGATDESGFTAYPAGRRSSGSTFVNLKAETLFWSATSRSAGDAWYRQLSKDSASLVRESIDKRTGASVRCIRD